VVEGTARNGGQRGNRCSP